MPAPFPAFPPFSALRAFMGPSLLSLRKFSAPKPDSISMTELDIQTTIVRLHGHNPKPVLEKILQQPEPYKGVEVQRAISYLLQFGNFDPEIKNLALQAAGIINLSTEAA